MIQKTHWCGQVKIRLYNSSINTSCLELVSSQTMVSDDSERSACMECHLCLIFAQWRPSANDERVRVLHRSRDVKCLAFRSWLLRRTSFMGSTIRSVWPTPNPYCVLCHLHWIPNRMRSLQQYCFDPHLPIPWRMLCSLAYRYFRCAHERHLGSGHSGQCYLPVHHWPIRRTRLWSCRRWLHWCFRSKLEVNLIITHSPV